jgi:hypothetical protein
MRILITGGREYSNQQYVNEVLDKVMDFYGADNMCIIQGGAKGADAQSKRWAIANGVCCINVNANWEHYRNQAGPIRNNWMLDFCMPEMVIAFPGGSGTNHMISIARKSGIAVYEK